MSDPVTEPTPSSDAASTTTTTTSELEEVVVGADSTAEYKPVVQLQRVEVATGEENEDAIYKQRAALYRFDDVNKEWKERGRGDVKLMQHRETKRVRLLLRQDKTLKCCMNHVVNPAVDLVPNAGSDRSWTWRITDYATDEPEQQTFAIKFKDSETASAFKSEYDKYRASNKELDDKAAAAEGDKAAEKKEEAQ